MKKWGPIFRRISLLSQIGISLTAPLLICIFLCSWLVQHTGLGGWIYIPGFFFGLGGSAMTAYKIYLAIVKEEEKHRKEKASFNEHK